ncbi:hypothetical protein CORC01_07433 [Colletotrichum orchidophilum]|uniref:Transcription factor domain-containing protein n=1 Tax=Colletotrichum orchidophilum TaxID=1209926 RepID=A0A1G4B6V5_9PEZI|nr:uncharacterized protein CORC01_07433 [Colletotrichum orchidophilum]OHE97179.1 hypothetical protein CORC01_07433 [Colletotrichum orchidophilum]
MPTGTESLTRIENERVDVPPEDRPYPEHGPSMDWAALLSTETPEIPMDSDLDLRSQLPDPIPFSMVFDSPQQRQTVLDAAGVPWQRNNAHLFGPENLGALVTIPDPDDEYRTSDIQLLGAFRNCPARKARPFYQDKPLAPRIPRSVATCFTAKVLLGQILSYPVMMIKGGRLPPFIFPPCVIEGSKSMAGCCDKEFHQCLPEPLAICCNLVQSFDQRTQGSADFVWKSIYSEVARLRRELLQALQAVVIYVLLQANDLKSIPNNDIVALLVVPNLLARSLHLSLDYEINLAKRPDLGRRGWILRESSRRTICLLFGIELLMDVDMNAEDPADCGGYRLLPLPSGRDLWETVSSDEWAARFRKLRAESGDEKVLSIQDLRTARRALVGDFSDQSQERQLVSQVAKWCEGLDEFGMMVWMAVMLE